MAVRKNEASAVMMTVIKLMVMIDSSSMKPSSPRPGSAQAGAGGSGKPPPTTGRMHREQRCYPAGWPLSCLSSSAVASGLRGAAKMVSCTVMVAEVSIEATWEPGPGAS